MAAHAAADSALWLIITPLARPVVPPVYSSAARPAGSESTSRAGGAVSSSANGSSGGPAGPAAAAGRSPSGSPTTTMPRTLGRWAAAAVTFGRNSGVVTTRAAPLSLSTCRSSSSLSRNSTGVATAAVRHTAEYVMLTSGQLAMQITTRSPGARPASCKPPATRQVRSASCSPVHWLPS